MVQQVGLNSCDAGNNAVNRMLCFGLQGDFTESEARRRVDLLLCDGIHSDP